MAHLPQGVRVPIDLSNPSIERIEEKCVQCTLCAKVCREQIGVGETFDVNATDPVCVHCGQCAAVCPTGSIVVRNDVARVKEALKTKKVVFTTSPAVRVGIGEAFGLKAGEFLAGKMVSLLRQLGGAYVFDTNFAADVTIMEEATELINRIKAGKPGPMFTSCCPAWVKFCETFHPDFTSHLSTAKSPISMQGALIKTYFAKKANADPESLFVVAVAPCTAKKFEITREEFKGAASYWNKQDLKDVDCVITTTELAQWAKEEGVDFAALDEKNFDSLLGVASGAGVLFGATGGVMEAALRTGYFMLTGKNPPQDFALFEPLRGLDTFKETSVTIGDLTLKCAVVYGTGEANRLIQKIKSGQVHYDFVEVMTCPGGCLSGAGQPRLAYGTEKETRAARSEALYAKDASMTLRFSHENPEVKALYEDFLDSPESDLAHQLLHTSYRDRSASMKAQSADAPKEKPAQEKSTGKKKFRCKICGYIYEGDELPADYVCPLCQQGVKVFEEVK